MSQPPDHYERIFDFTDFSAMQPNAQQPGQKIDQELNAARESVNDTIDRLNEIQRDDGKVRSSALDTTEFTGIVNAATTTATNAAASATASASTATTKASEATASATTAGNAATSATGSAGVATAQAGLATTAATTATTKATEASNSAASALASQTSATASAATATTKAAEASGSAATATTQASNAAISASTATAQGNLATAAAVSAGNSASSASTSAISASNSASAASSSASAAAASAASIAALDVVDEAPIDGTQYARKDGGWEAVSTGSPASPADAMSNNEVNGVLNASWQDRAADMYGSLSFGSETVTFVDYASDPKITSRTVTFSASSTDGFGLSFAGSGWIISYGDTNSGATTPVTVSQLQSYLSSAGETIRVSSYSSNFSFDGIADTVNGTVERAIISRTLGADEGTLMIKEGFDSYLIDKVINENAVINDVLKFNGTSVTFGKPVIDVFNNNVSFGYGYQANFNGSSYFAGAVNLGSSAVATTPVTSDNSTKVATTAFVKAQGYLTSAPVTSVAGRTGAVTLAVADVSGAAPLASPSFSGTPLAPSASVNTNTTQVATTAHLKNFIADCTWSAPPIVSTTTVTSGTGAGYVNASPDYGYLGGPNANLAGYCQKNFLMFARSNSTYGFNLTKNIKVGCKIATNWSGTFTAITQTLFFRINTGTTNGTLSQIGFGISINLATKALSILAHNGTTLTTKATSWSVPYSGIASVDFMVESDGTGTVYAYADGVLIDSTTGMSTASNTTGTTTAFAAVEINSAGGTSTANATTYVSNLRAFVAHG